MSERSEMDKDFYMKIQDGAMRGLREENNNLRELICRMAGDRFGSDGQKPQTESEKRQEALLCEILTTLKGLVKLTERLAVVEKNEKE